MKSNDLSENNGTRWRAAACLGQKSALSGYERRQSLAQKRHCVSREQQAQPSTVLIGPNLTFHKHGLVTLTLTLQLIRFHQEWCVHGSLSYKDVLWQSRKKQTPRVARKSFFNCRFVQFEPHRGFWKVSRSRKNKVGSAP